MTPDLEAIAADDRRVDHEEGGIAKYAPSSPIRHRHVLLAALRAAEAELRDMGDRLHGAGFEDAILLAEAVKPFEARAIAAEQGVERLREALDQQARRVEGFARAHREDARSGPDAVRSMYASFVAACDGWAAAARAALASTEEPAPTEPEAERP